MRLEELAGRHGYLVENSEESLGGKVREDSIAKHSRKMPRAWQTIVFSFFIYFWCNLGVYLLFI